MSNTKALRDSHVYTGEHLYSNNVIFHSRACVFLYMLCVFMPVTPESGRLIRGVRYSSKFNSLLKICK